MFYGYNPIYLITFLPLILGLSKDCFNSLERAAAHQKLAQSCWDTLEYPIALAPDYIPISQNIDWP